MVKTAQTKPLALKFSQIDKHDIPIVGGKSANLGEMTGAGFPVPDGFAVTVEAYDIFLKENSLIEPINEILKDLDVTKTESLAHVSKSIQNRIKKGTVPKVVAEEIRAFYKKLSGRRPDYIAARSSATAEDLPGASFAGQQETYLNVKGDANVIDSVRKCWASLFTQRALFYREQNNISHKKVKISVIIQKMIQSEVSGVIFTVDPVTNDKDKIIIEAVWGLGELIVQGTVVPDRYVVQKETFSILSKQISDQKKQLIMVGSDTREEKVPEKIQSKPKLSDEEIVDLAKIANKIQKHYYFPQDIEWARQNKTLYITQSRPVTTLKSSKKKEVKVDEKGVSAAITPILSGISASPGIGSGYVKLLKSPKEIDRIKAGDVLVAEMTSPDYVPAMKKAAAIVTNTGGQTSHAAIVSRELGIPCVVGTKLATSTLKEGDLVTVDGEKGQIYLGSKVKLERPKKVKEKIITKKTATRLYVNLAQKDRVAEIARKNVDGVGLLRAEFMVADIGMHPKEAIANKVQDTFINKLATDISLFCKAFGDRPVVYRATDFKTNEYRQLPGGKKWEPEESNPMLGFRGAFRYKASPEVFTLELKAIKKVREKYKNLWLMIPFCRSPKELADVRRIVGGEGLFETNSFKFWMMVELPVNVILLREFIRVGIDGVSIGSNDLSMLILGTDRDNSEVTEAFDERSPAVLWAIKKTIKTCLKYGVSSSICGQAPSSYDDLVQKLVKWGVTSISVNPDAINRVRGVIAEKEKEIIRGK